MKNSQQTECGIALIQINIAQVPYPDSPLEPEKKVLIHHKRLKNVLIHPQFNSDL